MSTLKVNNIEPLSGILSITGSFSGDGSNLTGLAAFPYTGSATISGSLNIEGDLLIDGLPLSVNPFPYVGTASISGSLIVTGSAFVTNLTETSAKKYKKNIKSLDSQTHNVYQLRPVNFIWKDTNLPDYGLIAEEVQKIYPELVTTGDSGDILGIKYTKLTSILIKTIQELTDRVNKLESKN